MIDAREAVRVAIDSFCGLFSEHEFRDLRLEEVELSEDSELWSITLSFVRQASKLSEALLAQQRDYKVLTIRSRDGQLQSLKIREPV